jgi:hypothetical protein
MGDKHRHTTYEATGALVSAELGGPQRRHGSNLATVPMERHPEELSLRSETTMEGESILKALSADGAVPPTPVQTVTVRGGTHGAQPPQNGGTATLALLTLFGIVVVVEVLCGFHLTGIFDGGAAQAARAAAAREAAAAKALEERAAKAAAQLPVLIAAALAFLLLFFLFGRGSSSAAAATTTAGTTTAADADYGSGAGTGVTRSRSPAPRSAGRTPSRRAKSPAKRYLADINNDGKTTRAEARAANLDVMAADLNDDGRVTRSELAAAAKALGRRKSSVRMM